MTQGSILGPLLFLMYINDLPNDLKSNVKHFADDTYLFTVVKDKNESANIINNDLFLISKWTYNWNWFLNQILKTSPRGYIFKKKQSPNSCNHKSQQHVGWKNVLSKPPRYLLLDRKLNLKQHVDSVIPKISKGIYEIKKIRHSLPRKSLFTI